MPLTFLESLAFIRTFKQTIEGHVADSLKLHELSVIQYLVLTAIAEHESRSPSDLADLLATDRSTISRILKQLVQRGLVLRSLGAPDARLTQLNLTPKGREKLNSASLAISSVEDSWCASVSHEQRHKLAKLCGTILNRSA